MTSQIQDFEVCGSFNNNQYLDIDAEITINLFEYLDPLGKKPKSLLPTSGIRDSGINVGGQYGFRAQFVFQGPKDQNPYMYCVVGNNVYRVAGDGTVIPITSTSLQLATTSGYVGIDANTSQIIIVDSVHGYIIDTSNGNPVFGLITDPAFPSVNLGTGAPIDVCYLDGFFVVAAGGTNNFYLSEFNNGYIWSLTSVVFTFTAGSSLLNITGTYVAFKIGMPVTLYSDSGNLPTNFKTNTTYYIVSLGTNNLQLSATLYGTPIVAESTTGVGPFHITNNGILQVGSITTHPGNIVACKTLHRRLFLFSNNYTEVWENQGIGSSLPFRRNNGLLMEYGCAAIGSVSVGFDMMFFLSTDKDGLGAAMLVQGSQSIPVSTNSVDSVFENYAAIPTSPHGQGVADARGILIKENGLIFYRLNFTTANATWVYNYNMSNEETKRWHQEEVLNGDRHPAQTHAYFNGINYYGNYLLPTLYIVSSKIVNNDGESIKRVRITKNFTPATYQRIRIDRLQIDVIQGQVEYVPDSGYPILLTESGIPILTESGLYILIESTTNTLPEEIVETPPNIYLSISKDGGYTYSNVSSAPMGAYGERTFRTVWRKLGTIPRGQGFIAKFEFYNQVPFVILGAAWSYEVLPQ